MKKQTLKSKLENEKCRITKKVCGVLEVTEEQVNGRCRKKGVSEARSVVWLYLRKSSKRRFRMAWIADTFDRKQSTVLHGIREANAWVGGEQHAASKAEYRPLLAQKLEPHHKEILGK